MKHLETSVIALELDVGALSEDIGNKFKMTTGVGKSVRTSVDAIDVRKATLRPRSEAMGE